MPKSIFIKPFTFAITLLLFSSSLTFAQDKIKYSNLTTVYQDIINVLKSKDDEKLKELSYRLAPDQHTITFMRKHNLNYKGIPENMDKRNLPISAIGDVYYPKLKRLRDRFNTDNFLENLSCDQKEFKTESFTINGVVIEGTETHVVFKAGNKKIFYLMGEMVKINGKWSLFTRPNTDYSTDD